MNKKRTESTYVDRVATKSRRRIHEADNEHPHDELDNENVFDDEDDE